MAIKWRSVKITDNKSGKIHLGFKARQFVRENCPDAISDIEVKSLADTVRVKISDEKTSVELKDVKEVLSEALSKFEAILEILEDKSVSRNNLPVARKARNAFNDKKTRLKVEFFYTRDPKGSNARVHLENSKVTVTALLEGATQPITRITDKGKANFGLVKPGKYKITAEYPESDECKYDWIDEKRDVQLSYGTEEIVEFEVEPLYQKVEFIAHCLTTIAHQIFVPSGEDDEKFEFTGNNGKRYEFKQQNLGTYKRGDLDPALPGEKALLTANSDTGIGKLTMKKKPARVEYWTMNDLDVNDKVALNFDEIEIGAQNVNVPNIYEITFKSGFTMPRLPMDAKAKIMVNPGNSKSGTLILQKKNLPPEFWTKDDLPEGTLDPQKIEIVRKTGNNPDVYDIQFKSMSKPYTANDMTGEWKSKYHGDVDDSKDIEARVRFIGDTLEKAYAQSNREATVLKVFMIPECFFLGLYGTYISDDAAELVGKLQNLVKNKKWKDWIFSFGTVNRVFLGLQPKSVTGGEKNKTIYEMANHAPVIRGGLQDFDFAGDDSTRLIQKLLNSLELADKDDLIKDPRITELVRKKEELVNEREELVKQNRLEQNKLEDETKKIDGIEIKRIRPQAVNEDVQFEATENDDKVAKLLERLLEDNIKYKFYLVTDALEDEIKKLGIARVARQIRISKDEDDNFFQWKKTLQDYEEKLDAAQESDWKERLEKAEKLNEEEKLEEQKKIEAEKEEKKSKKPVPLGFGQAEKASMNLEDYVFACPRKAGPLYENLAEARKVKSCKRLVFGLEICADHGDWRILEINTGANYIDIDIQLVPSAGQKPRKFAARKEGYIFNCDGWNSPPNGGRTLETHLDGPSPYVIGIKQTSPIYPHSAAIKRTTDEIDVGAKECLKPEKIETPSEELSKVIFGYGAGELHFYPLQDLPK